MSTEVRRRQAVRTDVLRGVDWDDYLRFRNHPGNAHLRLSYLDGTLILVSPQYIHDRYGWRIALMLVEVAEALHIPTQCMVSTTLQRKGSKPRQGSAKEPDFGFYFHENERRMRNKDQIDLEIDPPPDLAIEIDHKADSRKSLALYARLGVPEVWRFQTRSKKLWFGRLVGDHYESMDRSVNLTRLTPELVLVALAKMDEIGESAAKPWIRDWARGLPDSIA